MLTVNFIYLILNASLLILSMIVVYDPSYLILL